METLDSRCALSLNSRIVVVVLEVPSVRKWVRCCSVVLTGSQITESQLGGLTTGLVQMLSGPSISPVFLKRR